MSKRDRQAVEDGLSDVFAGADLLGSVVQQDRTRRRGQRIDITKETGATDPNSSSVIRQADNMTDKHYDNRTDPPTDKQTSVLTDPQQPDDRFPVGMPISYNAGLSSSELHAYCSKIGLPTFLLKVLHHPIRSAAEVLT